MRPFDRRIFFSQLAVLITVAGSLCGAYAYTRWNIRSGSWQEDSGDAMTLMLLAMLWSLVVVFGFGLWRAASPHPAMNKSYRAWLEASPWTFALPLPLGRVGMVVSDLIIVALSALCLFLAARTDHFMARLATLGALFAGAVFVIGYIAGAWLVFINSFQKSRMVWILILLPLVGVLTGSVPKLLIFGLALAIADYGVRATLRSFPWTAPKTPVHAGASLLGFQFASLGPMVAPPSLLPMRGYAIAMLVAWWGFSLASIRQRFFPGSYDGLQTFCLMIGAMAAFSRTVTYCAGYVPALWPISRIALRRWIMPDYDYVFLAPLATVGVAWLLPRLCVAVHAPVPLELSLTLFAIVATVLEAGPSYRNWQLTGGHRIIRTNSSSAQDRRRPVRRSLAQN